MRFDSAVVSGTFRSMDSGRRRLLKASGAVLLGSMMPSSMGAQSEERAESLRLFLCGDVMTGRGIDQVLPNPGDPVLYERYVKSARRYVDLAEQVNGTIPKPVGFSYVWGDALETLAAADARVINLETAVCRTGKPYPKGINYRMHPRNIGCITAAGIDCCVLANNHMLDWGRQGLSETLDVLRAAGLKAAGAGRNQKEAARPAVCEPGRRGRVLVFGLGSVDSGIPRSWAATDEQPGVHLLSGKRDDIARLASLVETWRKPMDVVVASIHWGGNWGYRIPASHRELAHRMIEEAGVDLVHGHSSHHVKGVEVHRGKLILYGCGDFLNDYEGIPGHEEYRGDLALAYSASVRPSDGSLERLDMVPFQMRRFRLRRASRRDAQWLRDVLVREGKALGTGAEMTPDGSISLGWRSTKMR